MLIGLYFTMQLSVVMEVFKQGEGSGFSVEGRFYGTGHTEVVGWFNKEDFIGAFGGKRQTGQ